MDLGCETGHFTIRFSDWYRKIVGIDKEKEMLEEASRIHRKIRMGNIDWYNGTLKQCKLKHIEEFHLIIITKVFHWMERSHTIKELYENSNGWGRGSNYR